MDCSGKTTGTLGVEARADEQISAAVDDTWGEPDGVEGNVVWLKNFSNFPLH